MAKFVIIFSALVALQLYVQAAPSTSDAESTNTASVQEESTKLDSDQYDATQDDKTETTQRQKRFYNYFSFGLSPYDPFDTHFNKRDQSQDTGNYATEDPLRQIHKRVQDILYYTRQQALAPPVPRFPTYVPIYYIPQADCICTPGNERPSNDQTPSKEPKVPDTNTPPTNTAQTTSSPNNDEPVTPTPTSPTNNPSPDLVNRFDTEDEEDGTRPISFVPIKPDRPLSRPPPPVEHGSVQGSGDAKRTEAVPSTSTEPPIVVGVEAQPQLPTDSIPTLCDGAVLTCCHRPEVTYECFEQQGCPDVSQYDDPCGAETILSVVRKFQYYYANRIQG